MVLRDLVAEFPVSNAGLGAAFEFISRALAEARQSEAITHRLSVVLDEICANMMRHDPTLTDAVKFSVTLQIHENDVTMSVRDPGQAFDPLAFMHEDQPEIGGHGISLVKGLSDAVSYERSEGQNCLSVTILGED